MRTRVGSERIIAELRRLILLGEYLPGEALRQEDLAQRLGVSRVPVREAFLVLADQGLLAHRPNQGFVVAKRTAFELGQLHTLHTLLETELNSSIEWPDSDALCRLRRLNADMAEKVTASEVVEFIDLNREFHLTVWGLSPMKLLIAEVERVWAMSDAYFASNYGSAERRRSAVGDHLRMIEALEARDMKRFQKVSAEHRDGSRVATDAALVRGRA